MCVHPCMCVYAQATETISIWLICDRSCIWQTGFVGMTMSTECKKIGNKTTVNLYGNRLTWKAFYTGFSPKREVRRYLDSFVHFNCVGTDYAPDEQELGKTHQQTKRQFIVIHKHPVTASTGTEWDLRFLIGQWYIVTSHSPRIADWAPCTCSSSVYVWRVDL
jgi:hypothetical protein